jgi:hypothetical protein
MDQYIGGVFTVIDIRRHIGQWWFFLSDEFGDMLKPLPSNSNWNFHEDCLEPAPESEYERRRIMAHYYAEQICEEGGDE